MAAAKTIMFPIVLATGDDNEQQQEIAAAGAEHHQAEEETAGKPKEIPTQIDSVPNTILEEILSRIPAKTVVCCKTLSKPWFSIVDCPVFARTHFSGAPVCPLLVFSDKSINQQIRMMHLVEGRTVSDLDPLTRKSSLSSRFDFSNVATSSPVTNYDFIPTPAARGEFLPVNPNVVSCEGIVCWASYHNCGGRIFLCNPITSEYLTLDPPPNEEDTVYVFIGLGFVTRSKRFELLRMSLRGAKNKAYVSPWVSEVLTVGDTYWRQVGVATFQLDLSRRVSEVVYVNGAIYWRYDGDSSICCFDFNTRIFHYIRVPRMNMFFEDEMNYFDSATMSLGVLANSLCVSLVSPDDGHVSLWVLESPNIISNNVNQMASWSKICDVESHTTCMDHSGMLGSRGRYKAITYLDYGDILMHDWRETFLIYDSIKGRETSFRALERPSLDHELRTYLQLQVVPHVPCLLKLNEALSIEGETVKVLTVQP